MNLDPRQLLGLIAEGEGKTLEFKRGLPQDERVARTLCAFANTRGGLLLVGVDDRGAVVGAPRPKSSAEQLRYVANALLEPPLSVQVASVEVEGRRVVVCSVPLSPGRPHAARRAAGPAEIVVRVGSSNRAASGAALRRIGKERASAAQLDALGRKVLAFVESRSGFGPDADVGVDEFARAFNIGWSRARRAFTQLELGGRLIGHGPAARRRYRLG